MYKRQRLAIESFNDPETYTFELGKGITLLDGDDVAVIATGLCVNEALKACKQLKEEGINARLINIHTIKPIDREIIVKAAKETGRIITIEEHNVIGGLGDAVCSVVSEEYPVKVTKVGVNDCFGYSGPALELLDKFELTAPHLAKKIKAKDGKVKVGIKTKAFFELMRIIQRKSGCNEADTDYWHNKGWDGKKRPWK